MNSNEKIRTFFNKKTVVSFFLSMLVVLIHNHSFEGYFYTGALGTILKYSGEFLTSGITGVAIRMFFVISGALFYRNYTYKETVGKYKSRFKTLVVPYLIWCSFYTVAIMILNLTPFREFVALETDVSLKGILLGVFLNYYYKSFWFIFNLIIFTILAPVFYTILRNKYVGAFAISVIIFLYSIGIKIPETVVISGNEYNVFWKADSIIFYMLGAYIGIHLWEQFTDKKDKRTALISACVFLTCSIYLTLASRFNLPVTGLAFIILMIVFCISLWFMFDIFDFSQKPKTIFGFSFMMFALNFYLGVYISKILFVLLPQMQIFCLVNLILTLLIELAFIFGVSFLLKKYMPRFYSVITGSR